MALNKAILFMGPTSTGKTSLAIELAKELPIEIISVDSALVYQGMDIGSAKPTHAQRSLVIHHLIDIIPPTASYSVMRFARDARSLIEDINNRGKIPLLVGGTMMYFKALIEGLSLLPESNKQIRQELYEQLNKYGWDYMYSKLVASDPQAAMKIASNDQQRLIRALEVYQTTGNTLSYLQQSSKVKFLDDVDTLTLGILPANREELHQLINQRFNVMLDSGIVDEVKALQCLYPELSATHTSMRCVGYAQVWSYLAGEISQDRMVDLACSATRQLAKRQITWLRSLEFYNLAGDCLNQEDIYTQLIALVNTWLVSTRAKYSY